MARGPASSETDQKGLNRGTWTVEEDRLLVEYVRRHGQGRWRKLAEHTGLRRSGKSCRLRWLNYLRPELKKGNITPEEEDLIIRLHKLLGNRWSLIAGRLPGRSDNEIKNYWNTNLRKKATSSSCLHEESNSAYENENLTTINHVSSRPSCYSSSSPSPPSDNNNNNAETVAMINVFQTDNIDTITSSSELYKYVDLDGDGHEDAIHRIGWEGLLPIHNSCGTMINDCGGTPSGDHENFLGKILMDLDLVSASEFWHAINDWIGGYCNNA